MGRYLAAGVMTRFDIRKRNVWYGDENFNLEKEIDYIIKNISNIIDPSMYDLVEKKEDCYDYALKPELFNKNIHELIREIDPLTSPNLNWFMNIKDELKKENKTIYDKEFIEKYPLVIKVNEKGEYIMKTNKEEIEEDYPFYPLIWLPYDRKLYKNIEIHASVILLWMDLFKYDGEDETKMLKILNNMKAKYYSSPLSKALIYYILG